MYLIFEIFKERLNRHIYYVKRAQFDRIFLHFYSSNCSYNMGGTLYICIYSQPLLCSAGTSKKQVERIYTTFEFLSRPNI